MMKFRADKIQVPIKSKPARNRQDIFVITAIEANFVTSCFEFCWSMMVTISQGSLFNISTEDTLS